MNNNFLFPSLLLGLDAYMRENRLNCSLSGIWWSSSLLLILFCFQQPGFDLLSGLHAEGLDKRIISRSCVYKEGDVMRTKMSNVKVDEDVYDVLSFFSSFYEILSKKYTSFPYVFAVASCFFFCCNGEVSLASERHRTRTEAPL